MTSEKKQERKNKRIPKASASGSERRSPTKRLLTAEQIELLNTKHEECISFSFIYFNRTHELFNCGRTSANWFLDLMDTLQSISNLTKNQFLFDPSYKSHYDTHQHTWENVAEDKRLNLPEEYFNQYKDDCWQFRLSSSNGRVHGFILSNVFYIVWLDPHHNFYPAQRFGGPKYYDAPLTIYQQLEVEHNRVLEENKKLKKDMNELYQYIDTIEEK